MPLGWAAPPRENPPPPGAPGPAPAARAGVIVYPGSFFAQYEPDTALDMVLQVPGFQVDDGGDKRGFGVAAGNILINDRRPSAKQDPPSAILRRIPASIVERIELIRGRIGSVDAQGHTVLANVVLQESYPASIRWDASVRKHSNVSPLRGEASMSISDRWRSIDYTAGISGFRATFGDKGGEQITDGGGLLLENRIDDSFVVNVTGNVHLNASTWAGATLLSINTSLGYVDRDEDFFSRRISQAAGNPFHNAFFGDDTRTRTYELGLDAERALRDELLGRLIFLLHGSDRDQLNEERTTQPDGTRTLLRLADGARDTTEAIGRLELDWEGWADHVVQLSLESAYNELDNALLRTDDTGAGPEIVDVPGADTRVEETRFEVLLQDSWSLDRWTLNYGIGAERSTISQSGDANLERTFSFLKPQLRLTRSHGQGSQTRFRIQREVAQLDFADFVSATVFLDDDLALGNPNLRPETTWVSEITHERRFGELAVVSLTAFHDWISDVQDLLPITDEFEAPGNIGDGRRWGFEVQSTLPLHWTGLTGARLDLAARWQDSSVTDPVTGEERELTAGGGFEGVPTELPFRNENEYAYSVAFRQDFPRAEVAWGWKVSERAKRPRFKVNELDVYREKDPVIDLFVETTRWRDIKVSFQVNNLLDLTASRVREIYAGRRGLSAVERREIEAYSLGRRFILALSGSF
jgi:hypothetical protein